MSTYTVEVSREDDEWLGEVPGLAGGRTSARTLDALRREMADVIVLADDLPDGAHIEVRLIAAMDVPTDVASALSLAVERFEADRNRAVIEDQTRELVTRLRAEGYSLRDVAGALGITSGRVSQIATR